jgi:parallel beta-helix repeat protein
MKMNNLIPNKKALLILAVLLLSTFAVAVVGVAKATTTWTVDDDGIQFPGANFTHPQDAVNAAAPGDTILVYPGTYDSRHQVCNPLHPTWCSPNDDWAPALIVYRDGLTIKSVEGPANTIIQSTHNFWSNAIAVEHSTNNGIVGISGWAPNAIVIVASNTVIDGFTLHRHFEGTSATYNTAGVMIGAPCAGCSQFLGSDGNTVENNVFSDVWHAVYIWHSSNNKILNNQVAELTTNHWAAISAYDGYDNAGIGLGHLSENNLIAYNTLANKGIALGAWDPPTWTSNAGCQVCSNTATQIGVTYSHGLVVIGGNTVSGVWEVNTDKVLKLTGVTYTGDTELFATGPVSVNLKTQVSYDVISSSDGSGIPVTFTVNAVDYSAITAAGGVASTTATLPPGIYTVETKVCGFKDTDQLMIWTPMAAKSSVLAELQALSATVTDKQDGRKLDEAIKHLTKSLDLELWIDETHLQTKHGDKVFNEEKDTVVKLLELLKDKKSTIPDATLQGFIDRLVSADKLLASTAISDAAGGNAKKIDKANEELGKGDARILDGKFTDAIEHYRNAWKQAIEAMP